MPTSLVSAGRMNARASPVDTVNLLAQDLFNSIEGIIRSELDKVLVLCPESIIKSGQDAGISVIAGLYCLELRATIEGKAEKDRLEYLRKQLEKLSSAVEEVTETACHACAYTKKIDPWLSC